MIARLACTLSELALFLVGEANPRGAVGATVLVQIMVFEFFVQGVEGHLANLARPFFFEVRDLVSFATFRAFSNVGHSASKVAIWAEFAGKSPLDTGGN